MNELIIKKAVKDDANEILFFISELAKFEKLEHKVVTNVKELKKNIFDNKYAEVIMLEVEGKNIGFALYFFTFSTFTGKPSLYLEDLYIDSQERQKGYGKETLKYLANEAVKKDCLRFEWSCLNWNKKAIDFYINFGALPQTEWTLFRLEGNNLVGYKK